ncbi:ABC transporter ATP-binding protein [Oricola nitratireducens]|uniref:ABC transporter ATP-binding protein n=1 Tax=Oricola nitratireducens TaxID=2775868 RepID=UPI0018672A68|nr:ABC transporter ATP-binding protein [Oricola nitratireducens]
MTAPLLARDLVSGYHARPVLQGVSVELVAGRIAGLIGPNGHGKTTLLRTLSGSIPLRSGKIEMNGEDVSRVPVCDRVGRGLVHIPQGDQLFGDLSVEENLRMGAYLRDDQKAVRQTLDEVFTIFPRLAERRRQTASSLSGGERRMAGIGRGLMAEGRVLMVDEPSLGLAPLVIEQIYEALRQAVQSDRAILVVEENPSRLLGVADAIYLMDAGRIVWSGSAAETVNSSDILATYLGGH